MGDQGGTGHQRKLAINGEPIEWELDHYDYKSAWAYVNIISAYF